MANPYKAKKTGGIINLYKKVQVTIVDNNDNETTAIRLEPLSEMTLERIDSEINLFQGIIDSAQVSKRDAIDKKEAILRIL